MFVPEELELTVNSELDHDELHLECDNGDTVVASKVFSDDEIPAEYQMSKINTDSFDAQQIHIYHKLSAGWATVFLVPNKVALFRVACERSGKLVIYT